LVFRVAPADPLPAGGRGRDDSFPGADHPNRAGVPVRPETLRWLGRGEPDGVAEVSLTFHCEVLPSGGGAAGPAPCSPPPAVGPKRAGSCRLRSGTFARRASLGDRYRAGVFVSLRHAADGHRPLPKPAARVRSCSPRSASAGRTSSEYAGL